LNRSYRIKTIRKTPLAAAGEWMDTQEVGAALDIIAAVPCNGPKLQASPYVQASTKRIEKHPADAVHRKPRRMVTFQSSALNELFTEPSA